MSWRQKNWSLIAWNRVLFVVSNHDRCNQLSNPDQSGFFCGWWPRGSPASDLFEYPKFNPNGNHARASHFGGQHLEMEGKYAKKNPTPHENWGRGGGRYFYI